MIQWQQYWECFTNGRVMTLKYLCSDIVVVEAELKIVSGLIWSDSLSDKTSFLYKNETAKIVAQVICCKQVLGIIMLTISCNNNHSMFFFFRSKKLSEERKSFWVWLSSVIGTHACVIILIITDLYTAIVQSTSLTYNGHVILAKRYIYSSWVNKKKFFSAREV